MSWQPNDWMNTPAKRAAASIAALCVLWGSIQITAGTRLQPVVLSFLPAIVGLILLRGTWRAWAGSRRPFVRHQVRIAQAWIDLTTRPPLLSVVHMAGMSAALIGVALTVSAGQLSGEVAIRGAMFLLAVAGLLDFVVLTGRLFKRAWARVAGKILAVTVGAALLAVSIALAGNMTHALAHVDARHLSNFTTVLACCLLPVVYIYAIAVFWCVPAFCQIIAWGIFGTINHIFTVPQADGQRAKKSLRLWWYRLKYKKWPPGGTLPENSFLSSENIMRITAPMSKLALVTVLITSLQGIVDGLPDTTPLLSRILMTLEYKPDSLCKGLGGTRIAYLDDGWVSVAEPAPDRVHFRVTKCSYGEDEAS